MKQLAISALCGLIPLTAYSQTITFESFIEDSSEEFGKSVEDANGDPCAKIIVDIPNVEGLLFRGNIIDDILYADGEYCLYVPQGTKQIKYHHEDYYPGSIVFNMPVQGDSVYRASLRPDNLQVSEGFSWLVLNVKDKDSNPTQDCTVLVDEDTYILDENGSLELYLEQGIHDFVVSGEGYIDYSQSIKLGEMPIQCSVVMLGSIDGDKVLLNSGQCALSKSEAKEAAWYLTDKMTHDLSLTNLQTQDVYEINYDYLRQIKPVGFDSEAEYNIRYRNLSLVLDETQWMQYLSTDYFLNPIVEDESNWSLTAYSYYDTDLLYGNMTSSMNKYDGRNAESAHYYQARGLGYRDAVNTHIAAVALATPKTKPFSRLLEHVNTHSNAASNHAMSKLPQRPDPTQARQRERQRQIKDSQQRQYRNDRQQRRQHTERTQPERRQNMQIARSHRGGANDRGIQNPQREEVRKTRVQTKNNRGGRQSIQKQQAVSERNSSEQERRHTKENSTIRTNQRNEETESQSSAPKQRFPFVNKEQTGHQRQKERVRVESNNTTRQSAQEQQPAATRQGVTRQERNHNQERSEVKSNQRNDENQPQRSNQTRRLPFVNTDQKDQRSQNERARTESKNERQQTTRERHAATESNTSRQDRQNPGMSNTQNRTQRDEDRDMRRNSQSQRRSTGATEQNRNNQTGRGSNENGSVQKRQESNRGAVQSKQLENRSSSNNATNQRNTPNKSSRQSMSTRNTESNRSVGNNAGSRVRK